MDFFSSNDANQREGSNVPKDGTKIVGRLIMFSGHCPFRGERIDRVRTQSHANALFVNRVNDSRKRGTLIVPWSTMEPRIEASSATDQRGHTEN